MEDLTNDDHVLVRNILTSRHDYIGRAELENDVYSSQIKELYQQLPVVLSVEMVSASLATIVLFSRVPQTRCFLFLGSILFLNFTRAVGWRLYRMRKIFNSTPTWAVCATIGSGLSGLLWGAGAALLVPDDLVEQTLFAFVIGGMCAAPLVSFSYYFPAFLAYAIPAMLPVAGRFFMNGWTVNAVIGDMILVFATSITLAAYNSNRAFTNLLALNFDLVAKTKELRSINIVLGTEIAQRKAAEAQLHQAQKMEAIGQLTGGIAHDFNNLLTGVIGHLDLACRRAIEDPRMCTLLQAARHAAERGARLTRQLLAFARRQHLEPRPVDVSAIIESVEEMLQRTIGPDIRLTKKADAHLVPAWVDPNQLELAILNLALNARDAMPTGGTLSFEVQHREALIGSYPQELAAGDYVIVSVTDTGTGMTDETLTRAFEPFFTTKDTGSGSGLGLSMVHGFAAQSGGSVQITSALGGGTKVDLWLPGSEDQTLECDTGQPDRSVTSPGQARILVCDDDDDVRTFVVDALRESGCEVWGANDGASGLEILRRERSIELLLVDYAMPEMNGIAVVAQARTCVPNSRY